MRALRALVSSEGWAYYVAHIGKTYGPQGYRESIRKALAGENSAERVRGVELAASMAEVFTTWPEKRIRDLEPEIGPGSFRRGGY